MPTTEDRWARVLGRRGIIPAAVFVFFFAVYALTARGDIQVADEAVVFATSANLATRQTLAIDELQWLQDQLNPARIGRRGPDKHLYGKYSPGNVYAGAAIYAIGARQDDQPFSWSGKDFAPSISGARLALGLNALLGALGMLWMYLLLAHRFETRTALITVALVGLGTGWWYESRGFLSEIGAGTFLIAALYFSEVARPGWSGAVFGISLLFRPLNAIALPVWGLGIWRERGSGKLISTRTITSAAFVAIGGMLIAWYNFARFGSILENGYRGEGFNGALFQGLYGILFSPGRSIFLYSPVLLLAIPGAWLLWKRQRDLAIAILTSIAAYVLMIALWDRWDGGITWGSRLLTPIIPLAGVLVGALIAEMASRRWVVPAAAALGVAGLCIQIAAMAINPMGTLATLPEDATYEDTLYTIDRSWLAIQMNALGSWQPCQVDAFLLRTILGGGNECDG